MNILYLVPHVPSPTKVRSYFHVKGLLAEGHRVTIAVPYWKRSDEAKLESLRKMGATIISVKLSLLKVMLNFARQLVGTKPLQVRIVWSPGLMQAIEAYLVQETPDVIHIEHLRMVLYGLQLVERYPVVWDAVDYLSALYEDASAKSASLLWRVAGRVEGARLRRHEKMLTSRFPMTLVISRRDLQHFQRDNPFAGRVHVALPGLVLPALPDVQVREDDTLIMTGTFDYHPNVASALYFVREILPLIQQRNPEVRLQLVGARPARALTQLAGRDVEVTGYVPDVSAYLQRATVAIAPLLYAAGMQYKIMEALMTRTPLVATPAAIRGLDLEHGEQVLIAESPDEFASAVVRLLFDGDLRQRMGQAGRHYMETHHELAIATRRLLTFYQETIRLNREDA